MAVRVVRFYIKSSNILREIVVRDSIFSFLRSFNRFSLARLVAFSTSLVTLRGGLDHPSSANGTGTVLPRKQSQHTAVMVVLEIIGLYNVKTILTENSI